jgi:hypothetical protein
MSNTNTGGPAFPQHGFDTIAERFTSQGGMTLRDYFAAKAMQAIIASEQPGDEEFATFDMYASDAYKYADAMIQARDAK